MTDYTGLIANLQQYVSESETSSQNTGFLQDAADAIEELMRERKELLLAVHGNCNECKHFGEESYASCHDCFRGDGWGDNWEWIGVSENGTV